MLPFRSSVHGTFAVFVLAFLSLPLFAGAGDSLTKTRPSAGTVEAWQPPAPSEDESDWIQLTSGEWLKGKILGMADGKLEFDSAVLKRLSIGWGDIAEIRSKASLTVNVGNQDILTGKLRMTGDTLSVADGAATKKIDRSAVVSIAQGRKSEWDLWDIKVSAGGSLKSGNTEETHFNVLADATRRTALTRFNLSYLGRYTESEGVETANSHDVNAFFDYYFARNFFLRTLSLRYLRDPFSNIAHRISGHTAVGFTLADRPGLKSEVYFGPGFRATQYESVPAGESQDEISPTLAFGGSYALDLTSWVSWKTSYDANVGDRASGAYTHRLLSTLSFDLYEPVNLDLSVVWDYTLEPTRRSDGSVPESSDFQLLFGVGIDL